ncbi:MAG: nitroreductase family protein [Anaerolineales bacterium]|nr:nitroreductase family protein [Anaerolineales bacterium]
MDVLEALNTRRSIRSYTDKEISEAVLYDLCKAGMTAPSAGNQQPWHFIVTRNKEIMQRFADFHPYAKMLMQAAAAIIVCGDDRNLRYGDYWVQDCSAATQNILLAAHAMGLGAVWLGVFPRPERVDKTAALFGLPEGVLPLCCVSLGYPAEQKDPSDRYYPDRIHMDRW